MPQSRRELERKEKKICDPTCIRNLALLTNRIVAIPSNTLPSSFKERTSSKCSKDTSYCHENKAVSIGEINDVMDKIYVGKINGVMDKIYIGKIDGVMDKIYIGKINGVMDKIYIFFEQ